MHRAHSVVSASVIPSARHRIFDGGTFLRCGVLLTFAVPFIATVNAGQFQAGAAIVDITPNQMPVLVNGGMTSRTANEIKTTVNARAIVVGDDETTIAIVVLDSCMVPKEILDDAKSRAGKQTGIPTDHILISATHTHTAPSAFAALGTEADMTYVPLLRQKIVEAIVAAKANLQPARIGWGSAEAPDFTALRRWVRRPDRIELDPFGNPTVRANMHAARNKDDVTGESGPEDAQLSVIGLQSTDGHPIAILCNFSMHYFGDQPISADYFGLFSQGIAEHADRKHAVSSATTSPKTKCVGVMSHGCSGDIWKRDYVTWTGKDQQDIQGYTQGLLSVAKTAYDSIEYNDDATIMMAETRLQLAYRTPDRQRLQWAKKVAATIENDLPTTREQVYAREQILLDQMQKTDVVVQAIRIGDIGIVTTPNETYALTGLKLKLQSPLKQTMVIELANGADGYIPPPEQHALGGYNTWPARSAGLEIQAEPKIVAAGLRLLEKVTRQTRRPFRDPPGQAARSILDRKPMAYYRLDEMNAPIAADHSGNHHDGVYESGVLFFLPGPEKDAKNRDFSLHQANRCVHTAGGRIHTRMDSLGDRYTVEMSFWNGMHARQRVGFFHATTIMGQRPPANTWDWVGHRRIAAS